MVEFASEPRTARSSPDWTAQHRCDSTQNWCPQSRVIALWVATLPTPWRTLPSALSCRVQMLAPQPSCPVPRQPLGRSGRLFAVPAVRGPRRFEQASQSAALALCPSTAPPGTSEYGEVLWPPRGPVPAAGGAAALQADLGVSWKPGISLCAGLAPLPPSLALRAQCVLIPSGHTKCYMSFLYHIQLRLGMAYVPSGCAAEQWSGSLGLSVPTRPGPRPLPLPGTRLCRSGGSGLPCRKC